MRWRGLVVALALSLPICVVICGFAAWVRADGSCPDALVVYDIQAGEYIRGGPPVGDDFGVYVYGTGSITWMIPPPCHISCARITDDGYHWLPYASEGSWNGGTLAEFWGGCQVPGPMPDGCMLPPRVYVPLVFPAEQPPTM